MEEDAAGLTLAISPPFATQTLPFPDGSTLLQERERFLHVKLHPCYIFLAISGMTDIALD